MRLLKYNPETGVFTWLVSPNRRITVGSIAGYGYYTGNYIKIKIAGVFYQAHRLAFLYMTGDFPEKHIDHKDHNRSNNKWVNLRKVTRLQNQKNQKKRQDNTSGCCGVAWNKDSKKWHSYITVNGLNKHLGFYNSKIVAIIKRKQAGVKYGFHKNHGGV